MLQHQPFVFNTLSGADPERGERGLSHGQIFPTELTFFQDIRWIILKTNKK